MLPDSNLGDCATKRVFLSLPGPGLHSSIHAMYSFLSSWIREVPEPWSLIKIVIGLYLL